MHQWLNARCAKLLEDLNKTPFTDDADEIKLNLIRAAMREASLELFHRAAENSRRAIEKINNESYSETVDSVKTSMIDDVMNELGDITDPETGQTLTNQMPETPSEATQEAAPEPQPEVEKPAEEPKAKPKIQISSSVIRRSD